MGRLSKRLADLEQLYSGQTEGPSLDSRLRSALRSSPKVRKVFERRREAIQTLIGPDPKVFLDAFLAGDPEPLGELLAEIDGAVESHEISSQGGVIPTEPPSFLILYRSLWRSFEAIGRTE